MNTKVLTIRSGNANTIWFSSQNVDEKCSTGRCESTWANCSGSWRGEGMRDWGGTPDKRPCAHADIDTAEALSVADHGYIVSGRKLVTHL